VCRLTKSLYGLKQASRQRFSKLSSFLINNRFIQLKSDYLLFIKKTVNNFTTILILIYVNDIILPGDCL